MPSSKRAIAVAIAQITFVVTANAQTPPPAAPPPEPPPASPTAPGPPPPAAPAAAEPTIDGPVRENTEAPGPQGAPDASAKPAVPEWMKGVTLGGGVILWWYEPINLPAAKPNVSVFFANLLLDGTWGPFGLHLEPRFRDSQLRPFFAGPAWLQEAYASADLGPVRVRLGKTYSHLGLFWDNSFYGNVQVYDGLKLDPDYGVSLDGDVGDKDATASLGWWAQYFAVDGGTNVSLPGRDTISIAGARRRNQAIARLEPRLHFGDVRVALGASGEYLQADLPAIGVQDVWRGAGDAKLTIGNFALWGEVQHQAGRTVTDFPYAGTAATATATAVPGRSSAQVSYGLGGIEYTVGPVTARYNFSIGDYSDVHVTETMHVPAIAVALSPNIKLLGELVLWQRHAPEGDSWVDRSFNLTLNAHL